MAVVGDILLTPEDGWKRYESPHTNFNYSGSWTYKNDGSIYFHMTKSISSISFKFYGTKLRVISAKNFDHSNNVVLTIDGVSYTTSLHAPSAVYAVLIFENTNLSLGIHEVTITNNSTNYFDFDAIDIDDTGRLIHPYLAEKYSFENMEIGDCIPCEYIASSGTFGTFANLGTVTKDLIPLASSATPDGNFYFIHTGYDHLGRMKLVADRVIQRNISWDKLNEAGIAGAENIISIDNKDFHMRLLSGGVSATDKDNEWDKIIAEYNLNGTITAGNNSIWNWSGLGSWTSSTPTTGNTYRAVRGNSSVIARIDNQASSVVSATIGFRPVLLVTPSIYLSIVSFTNATYNQNIEIVGSVEFIDEEVSNIKYRYVVNGVAQSWSAFGSYTTFNISVPYNLLDYGVNEITVDVETVEGETSYVSINVTRVITELLQPQAVYSNKVTLEWLPILSPEKISPVFLQKANNISFENAEDLVINDLLYEDTDINLGGEHWYNIVVKETKKYIQVAIGEGFCLALTEAGNIVGWGNNVSNVLSTIPQGNDFKFITAGGTFAVAIRNNGSLVQWGGYIYTNFPTGSYIQVSAGDGHVAALRDDGTVVSWGNGYDYGAKGAPATNNFVKTATSRIQTGTSEAGRHHIGLRQDGTLFGWGYWGVQPPAGNYIDISGSTSGYGGYRLVKADGSMTTWSASNSPVFEGTDVVKVNGYAALKSDGTIISNIANTPTGNDFIYASASSGHGTAIKSNGYLVSWGSNTYGQVGNTPDPIIIKTAISNTINILVPTEAHFYYKWVDEEYTTTLIEGLGFDSILTDYDFYTTPDGIKLKPLALGGLVGGTTSNIFAFEVINTYTNKNYSVMLKASKNGIFASDEGLLQDAVRDQDKTKIEFSESAIFEPVYPIIFTVNAGEKKIIYLRLKTTTITNGETTFQINMTGREI